MRRAVNRGIVRRVVVQNWGEKPSIAQLERQQDERRGRGGS